MFGSTNPFGQSSSSPFGSPSGFGQTNSSSTNNPFAPKPFGSSNPFGSQTGSSLFGTSTGVFGAPSSAPAFGASPSPAFGTSMPSFGAASTPAFGSSSSSFGSSSVFGQKPAFGGFGSTPSQPSPFGSSFQQTQPLLGSCPFGSTTFGAPGQPSFGASSTPSFGSSSTPAFGATTTPAFGVASTSAFAATNTPAFGSTSTPAFGSTSTLAFGSTSTPLFGSTGTTFGVSSSPAFCSTATSSFGAPYISLFGSSSTSTFGVANTPESSCDAGDSDKEQISGLKHLPQLSKKVSIPVSKRPVSRMDTVNPKSTEIMVDAEEQPGQPKDNPVDTDLPAIPHVVPGSSEFEVVQSTSAKEERVLPMVVDPSSVVPTISGELADLAEPLAQSPDKSSSRALLDKGMIEEQVMPIDTSAPIDVMKEQVSSTDASSKNPLISDSMLVTNQSFGESTSLFSSSINQAPTINPDTSRDELLTNLGRSMVMQFQQELKKETLITAKDFVARVNVVILSVSNLGTCVSNLIPKWHAIEKLLFQADGLRDLLKSEAVRDSRKKDLEVSKSILEVSKSILLAHLEKVNEHRKEMKDITSQLAELIDEDKESEQKIHKLESALQQETENKKRIEGLLSASRAKFDEKESIVNALVEQQRDLESTRDKAKVALDNPLLEEAKIGEDLANLEAMIQAKISSLSST